MNATDMKRMMPELTIDANTATRNPKSLDNGLQYGAPTHSVVLLPMMHFSSLPTSLCWAGHCREMTVPTVVPLPWMIF